jgi:hypothetical protein
MINDDDFISNDFIPSNDNPINDNPINDNPINETKLNEQRAMEASDYLLVNELFRNINDASTNDTPIINNKINVIAEKLKRVKRDNVVKDLIGIDRHTPIMDKRSRFTDNLKKDKLLAIKIGSMIDRIDEVDEDAGYYDIEDKLLLKR